MIASLLSIKTNTGKEILDITQQINSLIAKNKFSEGICHLFVTHTTCALTTGEVGEGTDDDLLEVAEKFIPIINFRHGHDPSHAWSHMASSIIGSSLTLPVKQGALHLGTWQNVLMVELNGPRKRQLTINLIS